jgi:sigma-B regulation protein RsbU (phosphoserine phosphatase)
VFHLGSSGTALGLLESSQFPSSTFQLEKDDLFVTYTDGITESENHCGEPWGLEGFETLLRACRDRTSGQIVCRILDEVSTFADDRSQVDDMTLVVLRVNDDVGV